MRWFQSISSFSLISTSAARSAKPSHSASTPASSTSDETFSPSEKTTNDHHHHHHSSSNSRSRLILRIGGGSRQRKLHHATDQDLSVAEIPTKVKPAPDSSQTVELSRSTSSSSAPLPSTRLSTSAPLPLPLPLPLPVPEHSNSGDGDLRLSSRKEKGRDGIRERDKERGDGEGALSPSPFASAFVGRDAKKIMEHPEASMCKKRQDLISYQDDFRLGVPIRSAPTSPLASPSCSPHRKSAAADLHEYYKMIAKGDKVWSAPEQLRLDVSVLPPPAYFDISAFSTDSSPFHSPPNRSPRQHPKSPGCPMSPLNARLTIEASSPWHENNANIEVHPLPRPPGAPIQSPSAPNPQVICKKGQWQKGKLIGRGTFGSVYVASNRETGALCAMKEVELFPDDPKSAECIKQLEQEIKLLSQLKHPNIVQYYGSETDGDCLNIYLEYVHPGSINKYIREHCEAITESVVRNFTRHILSGLAYLHSMKTIHRDIKGANLLVDASGVVKLADFGMAKHLTGQAADLSLKGSPYWMAPELMQAVMQKETSTDLALAVDIWSLGCTIIEMFTGKPPWSEFEGAAAMFKVMKDTPGIPETLSPDGKDFIRCCLCRSPKERPSATMLLEHRWLKNSQHLDALTPTQSVSRVISTDISSSPRRSDFKLDQLPTLPSSRSEKGKVYSDSSCVHPIISSKTVTNLTMRLPS